MAKLSVSIRVLPHPSEIPAEELDQLFKGEISDFEKWLMDQQAKAGVLKPSPLISAEHAILRSFMFYIHGKSNGERTQDQAD